MEDFETLKDKILIWARDKDLLKEENAPKQMMKVVEEIGETSGAILKNRQADIEDGIGDILVTVIILSEQLKIDPVDCLGQAYKEISNRTGKTRGGVFVKDEA